MQSLILFGVLLLVLVSGCFGGIATQEISKNQLPADYCGHPQISKLDQDRHHISSSEWESNEISFTTDYRKFHLCVFGTEVGQNENYKYCAPTEVTRTEKDETGKIIKKEILIYTAVLNENNEVIEETCKRD